MLFFFFYILVIDFYTNIWNNERNSSKFYAVTFFVHTTEVNGIQCWLTSSVLHNISFCVLFVFHKKCMLVWNDMRVSKLQYFHCFGGSY